MELKQCLSVNFLKDINIFWCFWHLLKWIKANLTHSKRIHEIFPRMKLLPFESPLPQDNIKDKASYVILSHKERKEFFSDAMKSITQLQVATLWFGFLHYFLYCWYVYPITLASYYFHFNIHHHWFLKIVLLNSQDTTNFPFSLFVCHVFSNSKLCKLVSWDISVIVLLVLFYWDPGQSKAFSEAQMKGQMKSSFISFSRGWLGMVQWVWWSGHCKSKVLVPGNLTFTPGETGFINIIFVYL